MYDLAEIRLRLARADDDGRQAWSEATAIARRIINGRGRGVADHDALHAIAERLDRVRFALDDLTQVEELLARVVTGTRRRPVSAFEQSTPCVRCRRTDALFQVTVCARCSALGPRGRSTGW